MLVVNTNKRHSRCDVSGRQEAPRFYLLSFSLNQCDLEERKKSFFRDGYYVTEILSHFFATQMFAVNVVHWILKQKKSTLLQSLIIILIIQFDILLPNYYCITVYCIFKRYSTVTPQYVEDDAVADWCSPALFPKLVKNAHSWFLIKLWKQININRHHLIIYVKRFITTAAVVKALYR